MVDSTQTNPQKNSFALYVYLMVQKEYRLPTERETNKTKSGISYHGRRLQALGIIGKTSPRGGTYKVLVSKKEAQRRLNSSTKEKFVTTKTTDGNSYKFKRVHSIQARLTLPKFDHWYKILQKYMDKKGIPYELNKKNQFKITLMHEGLRHTFLLCRTCIIFYLPNGKDFISDDVDFAMDLVKVYCNGLLTAFCGYFGKDLRYKGEFKVEITRKHIAMMNNSVAKVMHKKKTNLEVYIDGKLRMITDNSFNWNELEAVNNKLAVPDVKKMELFIKDVLETGSTLSEIKDRTDNDIMSVMDSVKKLTATVKAQQKLLEMVTDKTGFKTSDFI